MTSHNGLSLILLSGLLFGCSSATGPASPPLPRFDSPVSQALMQQHSRWQGTRYQLGGTSREGIDCSAFTQITFNEQFAVDLPRTTQDQLNSGVSVARADLRPGDLVFFRTGSKQRHVGVYLEQGVFLHASTSRGVTLSRLSNPYWNQTYWTARRPKGSI